MASGIESNSDLSRAVEDISGKVDRRYSEAERATGGGLFGWPLKGIERGCFCTIVAAMFRMKERIRL